jgi:hypothetical protein
MHGFLTLFYNCFVCRAERFFFSIKRKKPLDIEMGKMRLTVLWISLNPLIEKYKSAPETERAKTQWEYNKREC